MIKKTISGFTLIELLMVISIITLISSIFFSYIGSANAKSRDSVRLSDMKQINTAATMYYEDKGEAPDSVDVLVSTGYLSAVPVDPKTKQSYSYQSAYLNGKKVFTASATYEKIFTTNSEGEDVPQKVGVIVGDIDISNICSLINDFKTLTGQSVDMNYPTCMSGSSNDQIIGVTSGHRNSESDNGDIVIDNISSCSVVDINKNCPSPMVGTPCYCNSGIYNIDVSQFSQTECENLSNYGTYWFADYSMCVNEIICTNNFSYTTKWINNTCYVMTEMEVGCYDNGGLWDDMGCYKIVDGVRKEFDYLLEISCYNNNGVWLEEMGICLTQENCEQYFYSPYNRYWSDSGNVCAQALDRAIYSSQNGCENNGGEWLISESLWYCHVPMTLGQCNASLGDLWSGGVCTFTNDTAFEYDNGGNVE